MTTLAIIILILVFLVVFLSNIQEGNGLPATSMLASFVTAVVYTVMLIVSSILTKPVEGYYKTNITPIYSLPATTSHLSGAFILGSGTISQTDSFVVYTQNKDGSKSRLTIPTRGLKIYEGTDNPRYETVECKESRGERIFNGFLYTLGKKSNKCEGLNQIGYFTYKIRKLYIPENSIEVQFNLN